MVRSHSVEKHSPGKNELGTGGGYASDELLQVFRMSSGASEAKFKRTYELQDSLIVVIGLTR
jgi:hypothetical protein